MPLYELFVISRAVANNTSELQQVMKRTATRLLDSNALVRKVEYMGAQRLPYRMKLQEQYVYDGNYWQIQFFSPVKTLDELRFHLKFDPDIVRYTILKRADSLKGYIQPL